jgi:hypothetical protein
MAPNHRSGQRGGGKLLRSRTLCEHDRERSAYWYVGNRNLVLSWVPKYLLLPFCGAILAVLFYFVVRGGFFSPRANSMHTSQYGFCALACMVGLFSEQAVLKLKQIAETVFMTTEQGKDAGPPPAESKPEGK